MKKITAILTALLLLVSGIAAAAGEESEILRRGDTGEQVRQIQIRLIELGYLEEEASGVFDEATEAALIRFQADHGLLKTGMGDRTTIAILETTTQKAGEYGSWTDVETEEAFCAPAPMSTSMPASPKLYAGAAAERAYGMNAPAFSTDEFTHFEGNRFLGVRSAPLSTFAADVDTSSYAIFRRRVLMGETVPADSIRAEEMLNYFHYDYPQPAGDEPFGVSVEYAYCPWNPETRLLQIGIQARTVPAEERPRHNLVFLIDTSGSMRGEDRLDLVKRAFLMLLDELNPEDTVSIVVYASQERVVIEGVPAREKTVIM